MKLSLCIATFNEQDFIHYPLESTIDFVDEVVAVDGGSTDKTVEKLRSYGKKVRVIVTDNPQIFHINKQKALDHAKGEWILQLDADEEVTEELREEILEIINKNEERRMKNEELESGIENFVAYNIPRKNYFLGRFLTKGGQYPDYSIRLYKNGVAKFPCKTVHENVEISGKVGFLKNPMLHYADPSFSRYLKRWHRYTQLDADLLRKNFQISVFSFQFVWFTIDYLLIKPPVWFLNSYIRHKGFMDGWQGFVFSFFSSIRFWGIYFKYRSSKD